MGRLYNWRGSLAATGLPASFGGLYGYGIAADSARRLVRSIEALGGFLDAAEADYDNATRGRGGPRSFEAVVASAGEAFAAWSASLTAWAAAIHGTHASADRAARAAEFRQYLEQVGRVPDATAATVDGRPYQLAFEDVCALPLSLEGEATGTIAAPPREPAPTGAKRTVLSSATPALLVAARDQGAVGNQVRVTISTGSRGLPARITGAVAGFATLAGGNVLALYINASSRPVVFEGTDPADADAIIATGASTTGTQILTSGDFDGAIGAGELDPRRTLTLTFPPHADWNATVATVVTLDPDGVTQTEYLNIPDGGGATITGSQRASYVVSITIPPQGGTGGTFTVGVAAHLDAGHLGSGGAAVARINERVGDVARAYLDAQGRLVIETRATGASAEIEVNSGGSSTLLTQLGFTVGQIGNGSTTYTITAARGGTYARTEVYPDVDWSAPDYPATLARIASVSVLLANVEALAALRPDDDAGAVYLTGGAGGARSNLTARLARAAKLPAIVADPAYVAALQELGAQYTAEWEGAPGFSWENPLANLSIGSIGSDYGLPREAYTFGTAVADLVTLVQRARLLGALRSFSIT